MTNINESEEIPAAIPQALQAHITLDKASSCIRRLQRLTYAPLPILSVIKDRLCLPSRSKTPCW